MKKLMRVCLLPLVMLVCCIAGTAQADQSVVLGWTAPVERENGEPIAVSELGGYEIRYVVDGANKTIVVPDGTATSYTLTGAPDGAIEFTIAAYDSDGLYSRFVSLSYAQPSRPGSPVLSARSVRNDVIEACLADPNCRVAVAGEW
jgi:hypothetical protein